MLSYGWRQRLLMAIMVGFSDLAPVLQRLHELSFMSFLLSFFSFS
jgi:hypothetical protein